jgi:propanol-preferring alcohol dehydrogenase
VAEIDARIGGVHAAVVAAVASRAFEQAVGMLRPAGTAVYLGIPGGDADTITISIASVVNAELSVRGSNVGTRLDVREALDLAARGKVSAVVRAVPFDQVNDVLDDLRAGRIVGRAALTMPC